MAETEPEIAVGDDGLMSTQIDTRDARESAIAQEQAAESGQPQVDNRSEQVLEKYQNDPGKLASAYLELQQKLSQVTTPQQQQAQQAQQAPADNPLAIPKPQEPAPSDSDFMNLSREVIQNGGLSSERREQVKSQHRLTDAALDAVLAGFQATREQVVNTLHGIAGGPEQFAQVQQWASSALPQAEQDAFNHAMESGDMNAMQFAMQGLVARYQASGAGVTSMLDGAASPGGGVRPFESNEQFLQAIADPRYDRMDEAYHAEINARLAASDLSKL